MGMIYYDYDTDDWDKIMGRICNCGHKLMMHAFTMGKDFFTGKNCIHTSQCTSCGWEDDEPVCRHFGYKKDG